jgi:pyruvate dehydrogenase phosphatase
MKGALFLSVLDGHGGYTLSQFANERLAKYVDEAYAENIKKSKSTQDAVVDSIKEAFDKVENEFKKEALMLYSNGEGRMATVGSCVLVAVIHEDIIYVANLGDSKARIIGYNDKDKEYYSIKLMHRHNSEKLREKEALFKKFPNEKDIVVCKRPNGTVCYVKGRLQPTRSLGDFHLKYKEFNDIEGSKYKRPIHNFNGPYISAKPEITVYPIKYPYDKYLVIATDGLCDFVSTNEVIEIISNKEKESQRPVAQDLLNKVLEKAAEESNITISQLKSVPLGSRRRGIHDDTTIILLNLKK